MISRIERIPLNHLSGKWLYEWKSLQAQGYEVAVVFGEGSAVGIAFWTGEVREVEEPAQQRLAVGA